MKLIARFWADESAATAIEYAMIACGIAVAIVAAVNSLGTTVTGQYTAASTALKCADTFGKHFFEFGLGENGRCSAPCR